MADFRKIVPRFFSDERTYGMTPSQKLLMLYCVLGVWACSSTESGIYDLGRGTIATGANIPMDEVEKIIDFFNKEKPQLLEYDVENHIVFVKSFFKHNSDGYLTTPEKMAAALKKDFKVSGEKCPRFWAEFARLNHKVLKKNYQGLNTKNNNYYGYKKFFDNLFALEESLADKKIETPKTKISAKSTVCVKKMQSDIDEIFV